MSTWIAFAQGYGLCFVAGVALHLFFGLQRKANTFGPLLTLLIGTVYSIGFIIMRSGLNPFVALIVGFIPAYVAGFLLYIATALVTVDLVDIARHILRRPEP